MEWKADDKEVFNAEDNVGALQTVEGYTKRYQVAKLKPGSGLGIQVIVDRILKNKERYVTVEKETGTPWQLVAALHSLESSLDFSTWLANGDSLSGPTVNVPPGLRLSGKHPDKWTDGAIISLRHDNFHTMRFDSIGDLLKAAEHYNGLGYLTGAGRATTPPETSPYLWSGTDQYIRGKYVSDGKFDPNAVSQQAGVVGIFKELVVRGEMNLKGKDITPTPQPVEGGVTWFKFFRETDHNVVVGYNGEQPKIKLISSAMDDIVTLRSQHPRANSFHVARSDEKIPSLDVKPSPSPKPAPVPSPIRRPIFRVTRDRGVTRNDGLDQLNLQVVNNRGEVAGIFPCVSGLAGFQNFNIGRNSHAGSHEPLPEGKYDVGVIMWAGGKDNYDASWGPGIGAPAQDLIPQFQTTRSLLLIHIDYRSPGTEGCLGLPNEAEFRRYVDLIRKPENDASVLYCDWGLGTCPQEHDPLHHLQALIDKVEAINTHIKEQK